TAVHEAERALAQVEPSEAALAMLQRLLEDEVEQPLLLIGLRGERAYLDRMAERLQAGQVALAEYVGRAPKDKKRRWLPWLPEEGSLVPFSGWLARKRAVPLDHWAEVVEAPKLRELVQEKAIALIETKLPPRAGLYGFLSPGATRIPANHRRVV